MRIGFRGSISGKGFGGKGIKAILGLFGGGGGRLLRITETCILIIVLTWNATTSCRHDTRRFLQTLRIDSVNYSDLCVLGGLVNTPRIVLPDASAYLLNRSSQSLILCEG